MDSNPANGEANMPGRSGQRDRQEWVRANFDEIFGTSVEDLQARGIDPRQYAHEHRDRIRQFAQMQRSQGIAVPSGRPTGGGPGPGAPDAGGPTSRGYGYRGGRPFGMGTRGGSAWIGILIALFALRFLLVGPFVGVHTAVYWVLVIGGILLVARVVLFSWLRRRRFHHRASGEQ